MENFTKEIDDVNYNVLRAGYQQISRDIITKKPYSGGYSPPLAGSFVIKKSFFDQISGYDEFLKYSENTEFFHRINLNNGRVKNLNFVSVKYYVSELYKFTIETNKIESLSYILKKHRNSLSEHTRFLYWRILGVCYLRMGLYHLARKSFLDAIKLKPLSFSTWFRLFLASSPMFSKRVYPVQNKRS